MTFMGVYWGFYLSLHNDIIVHGFVHMLETTLQSTQWSYCACHRDSTLVYIMTLLCVYSEQYFSQDNDIIVHVL